MARMNSNTSGDQIVTISVSGHDHDLVRAIHAHLKAMPGYATDAATLTEDTRRDPGALQFRYAAFVFHTTT